jgi:hypothetical protein
MVVRTTVRLPQELMDRARKKAAAEGRTLTSLIEDGLRLVTITGPSRSTDRIPIPVCRVGGGPMPGFEEITLAKIADLDREDEPEQRVKDAR